MVFGSRAWVGAQHSLGFARTGLRLNRTPIAYPIQPAIVGIPPPSAGRAELGMLNM